MDGYPVDVFYTQDADPKSLALTPYGKSLVIDMQLRNAVMRFP